jgi:hypothetical protein
MITFNGTIYHEIDLIKVPPMIWLLVDQAMSISHTTTILQHEEWTYTVIENIILRKISSIGAYVDNILRHAITHMLETHKTFDECLKHALDHANEEYKRICSQTTPS